MNIPEMLLNTLEELGTNDLRTFQWFLCQSVLEDFEPIRRSRLEDSPRHVTVDRMVESYCESPAVAITLEILRRMNHNQTARKLEEACRCALARDVTDKLKPSEQVEYAAAPAPPYHSASVRAHHSVVLLPTLYNNCCDGSINFNINIKQ